jgi:hypothetical protein
MLLIRRFTSGGVSASASKDGSTRRCCIQVGQGELKQRPTYGIRSPGRVRRTRRQPPVRWFLDGRFVVTSPKVLDERVPSDHDASVAVLLNAAFLNWL